MRRHATPLLLAALFLAFGFASLRDYNATWDEAVGDLFFGQRYFAFFTTFDRQYLDFSANPPGLHPDFRTVQFRNRPWEHYPVASTLATATSKLFAPLLDPFDGYHAFNLLAGAALLVAFYRFLARHAGTVAAATAVVLLFLSPRVVGDALANVKDFSEMVFFSAAALAFAVAIERGGWRWYALAGVLFGLALGTKANALFLPIVVLALVASGGKPARTPALRIAAGFVLGGLVFFLTWPYLWSDPLHRLAENLQYVALRKAEAGTHANPFAMLALTTPPLFLIAIALGLVPLFTGLRARQPLSLLLASWIGVIAARLALPSAANFDGVRHFLELFPPLAAIGGLGLQWLSDRRRAAGWCAAIVGGAVMVATEVRIHPFESCYWNVGLDRALSQPQAGDYWAGSYRLGLRWLNGHAEPHAILAVPIAEHTVRVVAPYRLRRDIALAHVSTPMNPRIKNLDLLYAAARTRPTYVMFVPRREWANELVRDSVRHFELVQQWKVDDVPVLLLYRIPQKSIAATPPSR